MTDAILNVTAIGIVFAVVWLFGLVLGIKPQPKKKDLEPLIDSLTDLLSDLASHTYNEKKDKKQ